MVLTPAVSDAIEEIRGAFADSSVEVREDGEGGAWVIVEGVPLGGPYQQPTTWVGFRVTFTYPYADVYPHFVRGDLQRIDGTPLGEATSPTTFLDRAAIQLSRRSNRRDPAIETALLKLVKVMEWLRSRP
jgi:hypothetical protein